MSGVDPRRERAGDGPDGPPATGRPGDDRDEAVGRVRAALDAAPPRAGTTRVVAVDGRSGAGKSTIAATLAAELGAPVVDLEYVYPGWDGLEEGIELLVREVLQPLAAGRPVAVPRWSYALDGWDPPLVLPPSDVVVVEGVGAGDRRAAPYLSVLVWVELDEATRHARAIARDAEVYRPHWERWAAQERALLARERTPERADVVVGPSAG